MAYSGVRHNQYGPIAGNKSIMGIPPNLQLLSKKAFRIIRRNYGCPGNDGISISDIKRNYKKYEDIVLRCLREGDGSIFELSPKHIVINDYLGKKREIFVYNSIERWIQECLKLQIEPSIEAVLPEYIYAFRRGKSDIDSYKYILKDSPKFILRTDIKDYFHTINKEKLLANLEELNIGKEVLVLAMKSLKHCKKGLPPGHVLSCMLSNVNLRKFDYEFSRRYTRYSDDMMFGLDSEIEVDEILERIKALLKEYDFYLNHAKTRIVENPTLEKIV